MEFVDLTPDNIRWIVEHSGPNDTKMTRVAFSKLIGVHRVKISQWIHGHANPGLPNRRKLIRQYHVIKARKRKKLSRPPDIPRHMTIKI